MRMLVLLVPLLLAGCVTWRADAAHHVPGPAIPITVPNAEKTLDLSLMVTGDDSWNGEWIRQRVRNVVESGGYIVNPVEWASETAANPRVRIRIVPDSNRAWLMVSGATFAILPGYGSFTRSVEMEAFHRGRSERHQQTVRAKAFSWLPLFWMAFRSKPIRDILDTGMEEAISGGLAHFRECGLLPRYPHSSEGVSPDGSTGVTP